MANNGNNGNGNNGNGNNGNGNNGNGNNGNGNNGNGNNGNGNNGFVIVPVVNNNGNGNNGNGNNGNGNNGNDSNLKLKIPTETPSEIVIPKDKVARIKKYFGVIRNLTNNNNAKNADLRLPRTLFEGLTDEQFRLFVMLVTMEIESTENHDELYAYLNNVFSILEQTGKTADELLAIDDALRNFTYQSMAMIDVHDEDSEDPFIYLFEKLLDLSNDPTIIAKSVKFYVLNDFYQKWWNEPTLKQSLQYIVYQIQKIGFDTIKPVADYVLLGDVQSGGKRRRRLGRTKKVRKH